MVLSRRMATSRLQCWWNVTETPPALQKERLGFGPRPLLNPAPANRCRGKQIRGVGSWSLELPFPSALSTPQEQRNLRSKGQRKSGIDGNPDSIASGESAPPAGRAWLEMEKRHNQPRGAQKGRDTELKRPACLTDVLNSQPGAEDDLEMVSCIPTHVHPSRPGI